MYTNDHISLKTLQFCFKTDKKIPFFLSKQTFCIPHGGGGPGVGSIGVAKHLAPFLPGWCF